MSAKKTLQSTMTWLNDMQFEGLASDHKTILDATPEHGGHNLGPTPKELLLQAMMGCTSMDVISILKKMRQPLTEFKMEARAVLTDALPVHFAEVKLIYIFRGELDPSKVIKAVTSSMSKYCGINYMISKVCPITIEIFVNNININTGLANFNIPKK